MLLLLAVLVPVLLGVGIAWSRRARGAPQPEAATQSDTGSHGTEQLQSEAKALIDAARADALRLRSTSLEEIQERQQSLDLQEALIAERDRLLGNRHHSFMQHRHSYKERRAELDAQREEIDLRRQEATALLAERADLAREEAVTTVLDRISAELAAEHPSRVEAAVRSLDDDPEVAARGLITAALQRQDQGHADGVPRSGPISLEELDDPAREQLVLTLEAVALQTATELNIDTERAQAGLRSQDPLSREVARQVATEVLSRKLQVEAVSPLILKTRTELAKKVVQIGERALWEMMLEGRPELAELVGTLHYRFSYGQNALLHCQETGYLCGILASELGMNQEVAREAGMLHDIGKAVDHDIEGSHAIIGGSLLEILGTNTAIVHAVKAHHFDEDPSTDLAMLTICADAISASRPGARRDTLASYLARLEQLQEIATRHEGVERAFALQAGREIRVVVSATKLKDDSLGRLSHEIAREVEAEMQYPGVIKVTVIRELMATAMAPAQVTAGVGAGTDPSAQSQAGLPGNSPRRRRRGGRNRKNKTPGDSLQEEAESAEQGIVPE